MYGFSPVWHLLALVTSLVPYQVKFYFIFFWEQSSRDRYQFAFIRSWIDFSLEDGINIKSIYLYIEKVNCFQKYIFLINNAKSFKFQVHVFITVEIKSTSHSLFNIMTCAALFDPLWNIFGRRPNTLWIENINSSSYKYQHCCNKHICKIDTLN